MNTTPCPADSTPQERPAAALPGLERQALERQLAAIEVTLRTLLPELLA